MKKGIYIENLNLSITKEGYYNVVNIINIDIYNGWSTQLFSDKNCTGHSIILTKTTRNLDFKAKSIYVTEDKIQNKLISWTTKIFNEYKNSIVSIHVNRNSKYYIGSGFIIKKDKNICYIVTAYHCIVDVAPENIYIGVKINNNTFIRKGHIVGSDKYGDVSVLKIYNMNNDVKCFMWGNSQESYPGEPICSIGFPLGIDHESITTGIIRDNKFVSDGRGIESISTDASIYKGCSGSPFLDKTGKVLGIVCFGINQALSWGMSEYLMKYVVNKIIQQETDFNHGYIGIRWKNISIKYMIINNIENKEVQGIYVIDSFRNEFLKNDILISINGYKLGNRRNSFSLSHITWFLSPGDEIEVEYFTKLDNYKNIRIKKVKLIQYNDISNIENIEMDSEDVIGQFNIT